VLDNCRRVYSNNNRLSIYINPVYTGAFGIIRLYLYPGRQYTLLEDEYNFIIALSSVRIAVEHAFGHVAKQ
jgi:hypothetical protein